MYNRYGDIRPGDINYSKHKIMREIKFRAFHTQSKTMLWFDVMNGNHGRGNGYIGMTPFGEEITKFTYRDNITLVDPADCEIMAYTGLTDKNGKEIYFDDLAICNGETYKIVLEELGGAVKAININKSDDWHFLLNCNSKIEVIGNIHDTNNQHII